MSALFLQQPPGASSLLAEVEKRLTDSRQLPVGEEKARAPDLVLPRLVLPNLEGGEAEGGEPADLLHVPELLPICEPVFGVHQVLHERHDLGNVIAAHRNLRQPKGLLLAAVQPLKILLKFLIVARNLLLDLSGGPRVGVDLDVIDDIPAVHSDSVEVGALHLKCAALELPKPAVADLDAVRLCGVHIHARHGALGIPSHGRRDDRWRDPGTEAARAVWSSHLLDCLLPPGRTVGRLR
mmetsp:Transcript_74356/g.120024  ORF Transcript_74356/g.120024 Transcript_74356/m.120024 type:complete len:238 (-) Transcript_74356:511-1224(-)